MPIEPPPPSDHRDGAYTVDTRRRPRRPASTGPAERRVTDDAYTVDTRGRSRAGGAVKPPTGGGRPSPSGPGRRSPGDGPGDGGATAGTATSRRRLRKGRIIALVVGLLIVGWMAFIVWVPVNAWNSVARVDNIPTGERPANTAGYNYLLVGSDSRAGLTDAQKEQLATTSTAGARTDTIILVHVSQSGGKPVLLSIPRDSYVPIPGYRSNKINAAFALGGSKLLTATVENVSGIHIDGYLEIGFAGFAGVVDSVGGVDLCVPRDMVDPQAGINLKKGCQTLGGPAALGYVRSRYVDPLGDIGRANRQRQFLGALMKKAATPSTVLMPWRLKNFADAAAAGLSVGTDTGLTDAVRVLQALRSVSNGQGLSLSMPTSDLAYPTSNGLAVKWDTARAKALFADLKNDVPLDKAPAGTTVKEVGTS